jgi:hypothetical protein
MKFSVFLFLIFILCNCDFKRYYSSKNIRRYKLNSPANKLNCKSEININDFYNKFGITISQFYVTENQIRTKNDSVGILKPFYTYSDFTDCYPEIADDNLLVIYDFKKKLTFVYDNILFPSNRNVFQELKPNHFGFIVYSEQGNSSKLFTNIYITENKIDSIHIESWGEYQFSKTYQFKNFHLKQFKVSLLDSLQEKNSIESKF